VGQLDSLSLNDMERTIKSLMSLVDEETWRQVGLFNKVDQLKSGPECFSTISKNAFKTTGLPSS
jgi:hypothetical protein